jgi:hypothetical protein
MSQRIADASAKVARSSYPLARRQTTSFRPLWDNWPSFLERVPHSNVVKSFQFYSARQHADQALPDAHRRGTGVIPVARRNGEKASSRRYATQ